MILYLSGTVAYCLFLLTSKFSDKECSKTDPISWLVIAIASSFWIVVLPISLIELINKSKAKLKSKKTPEKMPVDDPGYLETPVSVS